MDPECWFCGQPIREGEPVESLPRGTIAVHAICVHRDITGGGDAPGTAVERKAA